MRGPDRSVIYDYIRRHPDTDVRRIVADLYPEATNYEETYLRSRIAHHLTNLHRRGMIVGVHAPGSKNMKLWRVAE